MERLTKWLNDKTAMCIKECEKECVEGYTECHKCKPFKDVMIRLAEYEDAEEQGLLFRLPCKVGDTVYRIDTDENMPNAEVELYTIEYIVICENGDVLFKYDAYDGVICHLENIITDKPYLDYYRVFLTYEEAEQELANRLQSHAEAIIDESNGR